MKKRTVFFLIGGLVVIAVFAHIATYFMHIGWSGRMPAEHIMGMGKHHRAFGHHGAQMMRPRHANVRMDSFPSSAGISHHRMDRLENDARWWEVDWRCADGNWAHCAFTKSVARRLSDHCSVRFTKKQNKADT